MSFATPGMTDVYSTSAAHTAMPTGHNATSEEPAFFSNTGEISFKPSVRIYCGKDSTSAAADPISKSTEIPEKGRIATSFVSIDQKTQPESGSGQNLDLTVEQNAKLLAKMCLQARTPTTTDHKMQARYNTSYNSRLESLSLEKDKYLGNQDTFQSTAPQFERLVQEFIEEGGPEFEDWMELNPKRKLQLYSDAQEMYEQVVRQAGLYQRAKQGARDVWHKITGQKPDKAIEHKATEDKHNDTEDKDKQPNNNDNQEKRKDLNEESHFRLHALEEHTAQIASGLRQNHVVLRSKFTEVDDKLKQHDAVAKEIEHMSVAMLQNNDTIQNKFAEMQTRLDANQEQLTAHEKGLLHHHNTLERMGSDLRAHTQSAILPLEPQKQLSISQLNRLANNY